MERAKLNEIMRSVMGVIGDSIEKAVTQAYAEGVRDGEAKAAFDLTAMVAAKYRLPEPTAALPERQLAVRTPPEAASSERRQYGYGVVSGVIRNVIYAERDRGISIAAIMTAISAEFGIVLTKAQARESIKRMSAASEVKSVERKWFPTERFRRDLIVDYAPDENEAPSVEPEGASDVEEGATSSLLSRMHRLDDAFGRTNA
jgi:hypothetical protein